MSENIVEAPPGEAYFTITRSFAAPRRLVYKCYTEPQHMAHFWGPRDTTLIECRIDLRVGGVWKVRWQYADGRGWGYASVYLDIVPDTMLHYRDAPDDWVFGPTACRRWNSTPPSRWPTRAATPWSRSPCAARRSRRATKICGVASPAW